MLKPSINSQLQSIPDIVYRSLSSKEIGNLYGIKKATVDHHRYEFDRPRHLTYKKVFRNFSKLDWQFSRNTALAKLYGCNKRTVGRYRQLYGVPYLGLKALRVSTWRFNNDTQIARKYNSGRGVVGRYRKQYGVPYLGTEDAKALYAYCYNLAESLNVAA